MTSVRKIIVALSAILFAGPCLSAGEPFFMPFRENYLVTGIPLNMKPDYDTNDLAFQASFRLNLFRNFNADDWTVFLGYTQFSIWDVYRPSNPFRCSIYNPGVYADHVISRRDGLVVSDILFGYEHKSNGLDADASRSMDHLFFTYTHTFDRVLAVQLTGRWGVGSIGNDFSQEMFMRYQGYLNVGACYMSRDRRFTASTSVTPLFKGDILANVSAGLAYRPTSRVDWLYITLRYHYGYDENQLECAVPDVKLRGMLRIGVSVQPPKLSHKLLF